MCERSFGIGILVLLLAGCSGEVYVRDGVTDGDTFYLAQRALVDDDPVLQAWVRYSLALSTCQLRIGGDNPARATSFECELEARHLLLQAWQESRDDGSRSGDPYLDDLARVEAAGFLDEYVAHHLLRRHWQLPDELDADGYRDWRAHEMPEHAPQTRLIGSWNYARNVSGF